MDTQTILHVITLICAGYMLVVGVIQLITKKCVGASMAVKQANSEDVKKFAVVTGIVYILADIAIGAIYSVMALIPDFSKLDMAGTICFIPVIAVTIVYAIAENKIFKKK